ncbi:Apoptosis-inducing factor 2 [Phytophthora boehmeriae]|uniref:Apoptosis-inducing factor 2 n=1 Tax=Phytophthora boehmeriae TaxID=109152 RepID=A0A8T1VNE3_9STRA|nr:Apoptosis-inducing factor 2 [Phytophthora boehmeriae]
MPRIVVVGAGSAGFAIAQTMVSDLKASDNTEVVIFEKSKYYYHAVGTPRAVVDTNFTKKLFIPYDNVISDSAKSFIRFQRAVVTRIAPGGDKIEFSSIGDDDQVVPGPVQSMSYDYLVIATGGTYTVPFKQPEDDYKRSTTEAKLAEVRDHVQRANSVLIVGGGPVGIEVAGEIKAKYPNKTVTIVEGKDKLAAGEHVREKFRKKLTKELKRLDVKVVLGERLETRLTGNSYQKQSLRTNKGRVLESDVQLLCGGFSPTTELVKKLDERLVTPQGFIKVNNKLQLDSAQYSNIYVVGDANNSGSSKHALFAGQEGTHLAKELVLVVRKSQANVAKPFPVADAVPTMMPLGPNGGVSQLPIFGGVVVGNFVTRTFKSKNYFADMAWKMLGSVPPN